MKRAALVLGFSAATMALAMVGEGDAKACGGCFHPPAQVASDITDERMLLSVSTQQTTLYDQIRYAGSPKSFAWVLPIHGTVDVGLSADVLFDSIDTLTQTQIYPPPQNCPGPPADCQSNFPTANAGAASADAGTASGGGVDVTKQENVGPYATVQLHATDSSALEQWLSDNGFEIPADVKPVVDQYVKEGFDFLAMKLLPNQGVQAMRPVRVTSPGAGLSLPLRMAAVGTGATVGITVWVVADGRYEPQNFPSFQIKDSDLVWDWKVNSSNYTTLRAQNEADLKGKGWELESSITLNEQQISQVILSGGNLYGGGQSQAGDDYLPVTTSDPDGGAGDGGSSGTSETADQVRMDDIAHLFAGINGPNVRVTRMRSDIAHAAMTADFVLQASSDQSEISNVHQVVNAVNLQCPIYDSCTVVGYGTPDEAAASVANGGAGGSGGCKTATKTNESGVGFAVFMSALGLAITRAVRRRREAKKSR